MEMSFIELAVIGIVALVVLGPEKLPGAIRTVSLWIGRLRRSFNNIKQDIEREIGADDIRRQLRNEAILDKFKSTKSQVTDTMNMVKKETEAFRKNVELEAQAASLTSTKASTPPVTGAVPNTPSIPTSENATAPIQNNLEFPSDTGNPTEAAIPAAGLTSEK
jgi:sec-independent protein translocase protein TatB